MIDEKESLNRNVESSSVSDSEESIETLFETRDTSEGVSVQSLLSRDLLKE